MDAETRAFLTRDGWEWCYSEHPAAPDATCDYCGAPLDTLGPPIGAVPVHEAQQVPLVLLLHSRCAERVVDGLQRIILASRAQLNSN